MTEIDWQEVDGTRDWEEASAAEDRINSRVANAIGWKTLENNWACWFDQNGNFTGWYTNGRSLKESSEEPKFAPTRCIAAALDAARIMSMSRRLPFQLQLMSGGEWKASFRSHGTPEIEAISHEATRAICEAVIKAAHTMSPDELFAKKR